MTYIPINQIPLNQTISNTEKSLSVRSSDYKYDIAMGRVDGRSTVNKFGFNLDLDVGTEVIASFGGTFTPMTTAATLSCVSTSAADTNGGTCANQIMIIGIDENYLSQTEYVTLNGASAVTTVNNWLGVNRVNVIVSGSADSNVGEINILDSSGTYGQQAQIPAGASVTQQPIYHTQIGFNLMLDYLILNALKISGGGGSPRVTIKGFSYSRVTDTNYTIFNQTIDTSVVNTIIVNPSQPFVLGGREVLYFTATTDVNNTEVSCRFSGIEQTTA